ncbi:cytochrome P450 monooxygenase [Mycena leptocephala]|nr:cytochrome P450 monooxygenase [Mycena leptocephala]
MTATIFQSRILIMASRLAFSILAPLLCYVLFQLCRSLYRSLFPALPNLPGPKSPSLFYGNFKEMGKDPLLMDKWREQYGPNFKFRSLFNFSTLYTSDAKALSHIMFNTNIYQKAPNTRHNAERFFGNSIIAVETEEHKRQRKIMAVFHISQVRELHPIFLDKAVQLRDIWAAQVTQENDAARLDVYEWVRRMTLDVIGQAGFNYNFNALEPHGTTNELNDALTQMFHSSKYYNHFVFRFAQDTFPILRLLPMPGRQLVQKAKEKMFGISTQLMKDSKDFIKAGGPEINTSRDLLSILLKANLGIDVPEDQRLSDADVVSQIPTFIVVGHETTSIGLAWELFSIVANPHVQQKLREELLGVETETPTMDELHALPYLDSVVREALRLYSPVAFSTRMVFEDDVLPLSTPYVDKQGREYHGLPVQKGQRLHIPVLAINTDKELWGEDALEFKPERWENIPEAVNLIPGVWANILTFWAGPHGYRFSLAEQKALIFTLIRSFVLELATPAEDISRTSALALTRPFVVSEKEKGTQLPLIVKPYHR